MLEKLNEIVKKVEKPLEEISKPFKGMEEIISPSIKKLIEDGEISPLYKATYMVYWVNS